jgi:predicted regulator of Ras-like GTPase activity (Roadblock/LC7/MglB family)
MKSIIDRVFGSKVVERINHELGAYVSKSTHIRSAVLSTGDGFAIASSVKDDISADKMSAMSGSIYALADSVSKEVGGDQCETLFLEASSAKIVLYSIPNSKPAVILTVMSTDKCLLGDLLYSAKCCGNTIQELLT